MSASKEYFHPCAFPYCLSYGRCYNDSVTVLPSSKLYEVCKRTQNLWTKMLEFSQLQMLLFSIL